MKKLIFLSGLICLLLGFQIARAQSIANLFSGLDQNGYSIDPIPGTTDYVAAGTIYDAAGNNKIHVVFYNNTGTMVKSFVIDDIGSDDRAVKIIAMNTNTFAVVCYSQVLGGPTQGRIRAFLMDAVGTIFTQQIYSLPSTSTFFSLYPLDAAWDPANNRIAICGTAVNGTAFSPGSTKQAFILSVSATSLVPVVLAKYMNSTGPYCIANKIRITQSGRYFVTGSENIIKSSSTGVVMGIRNMLVDPNSLAAITVPLRLTTPNTASENSVDMYEDGSTTSGSYNLLVNTSLGSWGMIRVNKSTLMPVTGLFEQSPVPGIAYECMPGTSTTLKEVTVAGMQAVTTASAVPFTSFINLAITPGSVTQEVEYNTIIGNSGFATLGGFYAVINGYPLPSFMHRFAWRENNAIAGNIGIIAPITNTAGPWLNTKFIPTAANGTVVCPTISNIAGLNNTFNAIPTVSYTPTIFQLSPTTSTLSVSRVLPKPTPNCTASGGNYYKLGDANGITGNDGPLVYPNPSNGHIYLNLTSYETTPVAVKLMDISGRHITTVYEGPGGDKVEYQLPAGLAKGLYLLSFEANGKDKRIEKISLE